MKPQTTDELFEVGEQMEEFAEKMDNTEAVGAADFAALRAEQVLLVACLCERLDRIIETLTIKRGNP